MQFVLVTIQATAGNKRGPRYAEQFFANLPRIKCTLIYAPIGGRATLAIRCNEGDHHAIVRELHAAYPDVRIQLLDDPCLPVRERKLKQGIRFSPHWHSLRTHEEFHQTADREFTDPISSLLSSVVPRSDIGVTIACRVIPTRWWYRWWFFCNCRYRQVPTDKTRCRLFRCRLSVSIAYQKPRRRLARRRLTEIAAIFGQFTSSTPLHCSTHRLRRPCTALSDNELALLWHPPTSVVDVPTLQTNDSRELQAPPGISSGKEADAVAVGRLSYRGSVRSFGIKREDRRRHVAVIGKTGMGKSTLLLGLIANDLQAGRGVCLIDPHGDLAETVLRYIPKRRTNDVILFDAGDREYAPAYNPFDCGPGQDRSLTAASIVMSFKKLFGDSWGPRLENTLRNAVFALLEVPGSSFETLMRLLSDRHFRDCVVAQVQDPIVRDYFLNVFAAKSRREQEETVSPIQNKVGQFLSSPLVRAIVTQPGKIHLREIMDREQILIVNLSKGRIGEDATTLLGSLLVSGLQQAAMSRSDIPEAERRDCYLYVDEFQNFATDSFATILSEARKYRLNLTIANQYLDQMEEGTRQAVFGNVGSLFCFQIGPTDAEILAEQLAGSLTPADLIALPKYHAYGRMLVDGEPSMPFSMITTPVGRPRGCQLVGIVRQRSTRKFAACDNQGNHLAV